MHAQTAQDGRHGRTHREDWRRPRPRAEPRVGAIRRGLATTAAAWAAIGVALTSGGCDEKDAASEAAASAAPVVSRYEYRVSNGLNRPIKSVVIEGFASPVFFQEIPAGATRTLSGPAEGDPPRRAQLGWEMPDGERRYENVRVRRWLPNDFDGRYHFTIEREDEASFAGGSD